MAITLVINPGSASKKYAFYNGSELLLTVKYEQTEDGFAVCVRIDRDEQERDIMAATYDGALHDALKIAWNREIISAEKEIAYVGVRIVAPGETFFAHQQITPEYLQALEAAASLAPLHIPRIVGEIKAAEAALPGVPCLAISDSAFHVTIPKWRQQYSLMGCKEQGIRRFGYHGLSVGSIARRLDSVFGEAPHECTVVLHVGNGVSVTALHSGESQATTMGFTPASGVMMGSRGGDIDPGALIALLSARGLSGVSAQAYLQTNGGFKGLLGTSDIRSVLKRMSEKDESAQAAMKLFVEQIQQAVVSMGVALGRIDAIVLTGTAVVRSGDLRQLLLSHLPLVPLIINTEADLRVFARGEIISTTDSEVAAAVVPTDEMGEIARLVLTLV